MNKLEINALVDQLREGKVSRRGFMRRATALGVSAGAAGMLARSAAAQTPEASPEGDVITNALTREEAMAAIDEHFEWEEPQNMGGDIIYQQSTDIGTVNPVLSTDVYSSYINNQIF